MATVGNETSIEWTRSDDGSPGKTWNPVRGCSRVSPGCEHCYAEGIAARFSGPGRPFHGYAERRNGKPTWTRKVGIVREHLKDPLGWLKPSRIFVNSMSDLFHEGFSNEEIAVVFGVMALACHHTYQILTKRAVRMRNWFAWIKAESLRLGISEVAVCVVAAADSGMVGLSARQSRSINKALPPDSPFKNTSTASIWPMPNVWLGVSVEDQQRADERIPDLLRVPAAVRFLSCEPLLGPVDLHRWTLGDLERPADCACGHGHGFTRCQSTGSIAPKCHVDGCQCPGFRTTHGIGWVIVGGESGHGARAMNLAWANQIVLACKRSNVPCFVKQLGAKPYERVEVATVREPVKDLLPVMQNAMHNPPPAGWTRITIASTGESFLRRALKLASKKGGDPSEWPIDLRVQQFPGSGG